MTRVAVCFRSSVQRKRQRQKQHNGASMVKVRPRARRPPSCCPAQNAGTRWPQRLMTLILSHSARVIHNPINHVSQAIVCCSTGWARETCASFDSSVSVGRHDSSSCFPPIVFLQLFSSSCFPPVVFFQSFCLSRVIVTTIIMSVSPAIASALPLRPRDQRVARAMQHQRPEEATCPP